MNTAGRLAFDAAKTLRVAISIGAGLLLAHGALSPATAHAASPTAAFLACAGEKDDARRLACFDAAVVHAKSQPAGAEAAAPTAVAAVPALTKEERFGLRGDLKQEKTKHVPELAELEELRAKVTQVAVKPYGQLILTLDNGQVWYEIQANSGIRVKAGDEVTIKPGALGSFSVVAPNGRSSKVTRSR